MAKKKNTYENTSIEDNLEVKKSKEKDFYKSINDNVFLEAETFAKNIKKDEVFSRAYKIANDSYAKTSQESDELEMFGVAMEFCKKFDGLVLEVVERHEITEHFSRLIFGRKVYLFKDKEKHPLGSRIVVKPLLVIDKHYSSPKRESTYIKMPHPKLCGKINLIKDKVNIMQEISYVSSTGEMLYFGTGLTKRSVSLRNALAYFIYYDQMKGKEINPKKYDPEARLTTYENLLEMGFDLDQQLIITNDGDIKIKEGAKHSFKNMLSNGRRFFKD